jgi:hypothetical protein
MTKEELTEWAVKNGWQQMGADLCLTKPNSPKDAIVRLVLKSTVVILEIKKPVGKWDKITSTSYSKITADAETGFPRGLGLETMSNLSFLMEDNKNRMVFAKFNAPKTPGGFS